MKVSFSNIKNIRWLIAAGAATAGIALMISAGHGTANKKTAASNVTASGTTTQAPAATAAKPKITIDGTTVPTDKNGNQDVTTPAGKTHVEVSNGHTSITTSNSSKNGDASNQSNTSVNMNVTTKSSGSSSSGSTQAYGFTNSSDGSSSSTTSTMVNSFGTNTVNISQ